MPTTNKTPAEVLEALNKGKTIVAHFAKHYPVGSACPFLDERVKVAAISEQGVMLRGPRGKAYRVAPVLNPCFSQTPPVFVYFVSWMKNFRTCTATFALDSDGKQIDFTAGT